jgi:lipopolysaccharide heptosyltransferase II
MSAEAWQRAANILCVRLDALGDVLMTTPALRALREARPGRRLTLLTSTSGAAIAPLVPVIDDLIVYDPPWMKATAPRANSGPEYRMAELLLERGFDAAVIFTVYSQSPLPSAFLCYLAGIPLRLAHCRENPYQLLTDWVPEPEPDRLLRHEVRRQLDLIATVGCHTSDKSLALCVPADARQRTEERLAEIGLDRSRPWLVIHPGASAPSRRYPPESFAEAARQLTEAGQQVLFTGSADEKSLVEEIRTGMGSRSWSLAGRLGLADLAAVLQMAPLLVSNNTGPVHLAAAVGTPVVDLYALTNPQHTPWGVPHRVLFHDVPCRYCYKSVCPEGHQDCLRQVPPEAIVQAVNDLLTGSRTEGPPLPPLSKSYANAVIQGERGALAP